MILHDFKSHTARISPFQELEVKMDVLSLGVNNITNTGVDNVFIPNGGT